MNAADFDLIGLARRHPERYPFFLESIAAGPELARYDILFAFPQATLELGADGQLTGPGSEGSSGNEFLAALDAWWASERRDDLDADADSPFTGGWFLYLGYELAEEIEPTLRLSPHPHLPVAFATRVPVAVVRDKLAGTMTVVAEPGYADEAEQARKDLAAHAGDSRARPVVAVSIAEDEPAEFLAAIAQAKAHIAAGDIFQANLSRCWHATTDEPVQPTDLYAQLRATNPSPFGGLVQRDDFALVSSSPERLIRRRGDRVETRPIAGTRPRSDNEESDARTAELLKNPKERAEHIMLIDLERNDLGRVCVGGTVHVDEYMVVESYSHVHHIVSNVAGTVRPDVTPGALLRAVFPGGTITGCPKVRCMEIIQALEQRPRGAYTGSMGYLNHTGDCDLNILIRTMSVVGNEIEIAAGAGIVADSDPQRELDETRAKAKGMLLALQAEQRSGG
ncbi:MAG: aminodeoxychorismate synthase component I [Gammaproteobacteria bacterium]|nr:aminodeoxychorismate synthase component I [Gammaproteobacteria bacterium]